MECREMDRILDDHSQDQLGSVETSRVSAHLNACTRCADSWLAFETLAHEKIGPYPMESRSALMASVLAAHQSGTQPRQVWRVASVVALVVASGLVMLLLKPSATPPDSAASSSAQRLMSNGWFADVPELQQPGSRFVDGVHYRVLSNPVPMATADRIEVCEFFMFPCSHCFEFEQPLRDWYRQREEIASLKRVPVIWNEVTRLQARAFYTAQMLGVADVMSLFFEEIHVNGGNLNSVASIRELFGRRGVDGSRFDAVFGSDAVEQQLAEAAELNRRYSITSTPALAVNGRFVTDPGMAGSSGQDLFAVVDYLVDAEYEAAVLRRSPGRVGQE